MFENGSRYSEAAEENDIERRRVDRLRAAPEERRSRAEDYRRADGTREAQRDRGGSETVLVAVASFGTVDTQGNGGIFSSTV